MNFLKISILLITFLLLGCSVKRQKRTYSVNSVVSKKLSNKEKLNWQLRDVNDDKVAGISLKKAYNELLKDKVVKDTIIVAVIDTPVDIEHEYFKNNIWVNKNEISENNVDDDGNGYIDDIHGWNFLGNPKGENIIFSSLEPIRFLRKYDSLYSNKKKSEGLNENNFDLYIKASKYFDSIVKYSKEQKEYFTMVHDSYYDAEKTLSRYFGNSDYSVKQLDSLKLLHPKDTTIQSAVTRMSNFKQFFGKKYIDQNYFLYNNYLEFTANRNYKDYVISGDNYMDINDRFYGNNQVNNNLDKFSHGTLVIAPIISSETVIDEVKGVLKIGKIMPITISNYGDSRDKNIANAIKYAVDNGAKVINMSFGKNFSSNKEWVFDAFKYAEKNDVLIVSSAGNNSLNLSEYNNYYPNDNENNGIEVSNNFLLVGASSYRTNKNLVCSFSNYSNIDVDIFAPGKFIYTTAVGNKYEFQRGTSMSAAITSGIAALIRSYYPNLTAAEVKQIIMESGVSYDIMVNKPSRSKEKELVPFSSLSKSGKIVNAYNALLLAEKVSKGKKK